MDLNPEYRQVSNVLDHCASMSADKPVDFSQLQEHSVHQHLSQDGSLQTDTSAWLLESAANGRTLIHVVGSMYIRCCHDYMYVINGEWVA